MNLTTDFLIIGGGVIGINLALEAKRRYPGHNVTLIEKEQKTGMHASGRNSGVLHAGFYYTADSLKAQLTRNGNQLLTDYCEQRKIRINRCGKLVVAQKENELAGLKELINRAKNNNVELHEISEKEAKEIEPRIKTFKNALFSPTTSSVDPQEVMNAFSQDAEQAGVKILNDTKYIYHTQKQIVTSNGTISAGYAINAAGLYADTVARDFGFSQDYRILPFKGLYLYNNHKPTPLSTHVYPVPNLSNPFLGVHHTVTVNGSSKIGPTAIPCFWREHYKGLDNFSIKEFSEVVLRELGLFIRNDFEFRKLAWEELQKYYRPRIVHLASKLLSGVRKEHYTKWGKPGIRAQLYDLKNRKLEMDFKYEGDKQSFHILNAVSPAFTCSISFSKYVFQKIEELLH